MVSVIIPTYNGEEKLRVLLPLLIDQIQSIDEVLFVIDGSTDSSETLLASYLSQIPQLSVIVKDNGGRASVRNSGAKAARGNLLIFLDDDMLPEPGFFDTHFRHHQQYPNSILTGAQIEFVKNWKDDVQKYRAALREKWNKPNMVLGEVLFSEKNFSLTAANFSISKELFWRVGGFNEQLTDGEDFDLAFRAVRLGISIYYNHRAFAWHNDFVDFRQYVKRNREYWDASRRLQKVNPELYVPYYKLRENKLNGFRRLFYIVFAHRLWIEAVDHNLFFFIPSKIRYLLYNLILMANCAYHPKVVKL